MIKSFSELEITVIDDGVRKVMHVGSETPEDPGFVSFSITDDPNTEEGFKSIIIPKERVKEIISYLQSQL